MQAIDRSARRIANFGCAHKLVLYYAACVCLVIVAVGLRFHDLPEHQLRYDEAAAANYSKGTFSEVISNTRYHNSSPILYPLVLWAVQKVESTIFSARIVPATASVLVVVAMLFLLPRVGVARRVAFLAGLLATFSIAAIEHAQDVREYSIDALLAVLTIAGLLRYLWDGRKALLCISLFLAPLLQYGLVLFGIAIIGAAAVAPSASGQERRNVSLGWIRDWLKRRLDLAVPCGFFLLGSAISYLVTTRYQWHQPDFAVDAYLSRFYYQGEFDTYSIFEFSIGKIWSLLTYHLPKIVAIMALPAFATFLIMAFLGESKGKLQASAIVALLSFCIVVSVGATTLGIYPLGGIRQAIYLGPIVFLAVGLAFHSVSEALASTTRQAWLGSLLIVLSAGAIVHFGVDAMRRVVPYWLYDKGEDILSALQERAQKEDVLFYSTGMRELIEFHGKPNLEGLAFDRKVPCWDAPDLCFQEFVAEIIPKIGRNRLWLVSYDPWLPLEVLQTLAAQAPFEHVVSGGTPNLYLIEDAKSLVQIDTLPTMLKDSESLLSSKPLIRSTFDVYFRENKLVYFKELCSAEDVQGTFFLHVVPVDENDLPVHRQRYSYDNLDFGFRRYGWRLDKGCVILRELPDYEFTIIRTGQFVVNKDGSLTHRWEAEVRFDE